MRGDQAWSCEAGHSYDIARSDAGWFEAAITSGEEAAGRVLARLAGGGLI